MNDVCKTLLSNLVQISRIDAQLAGIEGERVRARNEAALNAKKLIQLKNEVNLLQNSCNDKQTKVHTEELRVRDEREKLVSRRKALVTLNNYKLQQSAEKEIEYASKALDSQEDVLIKMMEELESFTLRLSTSKTALKAQEKLVEDEQLEVQSLFVTLKEREDTHLDEKAALVAQVDAGSLSTYNRVRERFPKDAVVALKDGNCTGCLMKLGPQIILQLSKSDSVIKCRGCGRILFLDDGMEGGL